MRAAAGLAIVLALAGCSGGNEGTPSSPSTTAPRTETRTQPRDVVEAPPPDLPSAEPSEAPWLNELAALYRDLDRALQGIGRELDDSDPEVEDVAEALGELQACARDHLPGLDQAPTPRLRPAARLVRRACERFAAGARVAPAALLRDEAARERTLAAWDEGSRLLRRANERLPAPRLPYLLPMPSVAGDVPFSHIDPRLAAVARDVFRIEADVRCWADEEWPLLLERLGYEEGVIGMASLGSDTVNLVGPACSELSVLTHEGRQPEGDDLSALADAVVLFTHELRHLREGSNEAVVECVAVQRADEIAVALGADEGYARRLVLDYWRYAYPSLPREYRSPECREGGALDRDPERRVFP